MAIEIRSLSQETEPELFERAVTYLADQWGYPESTTARRWITDVTRIHEWTRGSVFLRDEEVVGVCFGDVSLRVLSETEGNPEQISIEIYGAIHKGHGKNTLGRLLRATADQFETEGCHVASISSIGITGDRPFGHPFAHALVEAPKTLGPRISTITAYIHLSDLPSNP